MIALFDSNDPHHTATLDVLRSGIEAGLDFSLPASVLSEVLVGATRHSDAAASARRHELRRLFGDVRVIDSDVAVAAARLRARHRSLRLPDALVIATAIVDDAESVLTADKRWADVDNRVQVLGA
ncbi:MAG TPA: PIN domain-containing protein [Actinophytocola sp.]|uniref:type II toxin-antitoxin system VapC family toxin n=1 Tax=Actinophytocola sp. TaxID=1872138 RepID=UPI002DBDF3AE|nr:PIN domain-containing protein [Actinophytocola sp.]HEU5470066.1 PIN domain-containing protein [Actinophytocola sp.]